MKKLGLIGYTGFVGGNLSCQYDFKFRFNSKNINESSGLNFSCLICAAAPGSMYHANKYPERDYANIIALINNLKKLKTDRLVLISTIAVFEDFNGENDEVSEHYETKKPYGKHRRILEQFVEQNFSKFLIVRLPSLFGDGLKKNLIFDLMNPMPSFFTQEGFANLESKIGLREYDEINRYYYFSEKNGVFVLDRKAFNRSSKKRVFEKLILSSDVSSLNFHNRDSAHQFYNLANLSRDIEIAIANDLSKVNLVSEPLKVSKIF